MLDGGAGNDFINHARENHTAGPGLEEDNMADILHGGGGDDTIEAGKRDTALGGSDTDSLVVFSYDFDASVPDTLLRLNFAGVTGSTAVSTGYFGLKAGQFESVTVDITNAGHGSTVVGTSGDDSLFLRAFASETDATSRDGQVSIYGGDGDDVLSSGSNRDRLFGGSGDDQILIDGGDIIRGGAGQDRYIVNFPRWDPNATPPGFARPDLVTIQDFRSADDTIILVIPPREDYGALGIEPNIQFGDIHFVKNANPFAPANTAGKAVMLYETDTGKLSIDTNGSTAGGVIMIAMLTGKPAMTADDIALQYGF